MPSLHALLKRLSISPRGRRKVQPKAKALLQDDAGRILLIKHPREGRWRLPGGFVQENESAYEAVGRAVQALTGLRALDPRPIARIDESQFRPDAMYGDFFQMYATLFLIDAWRETSQPSAADWLTRFFPADALPHALHDEVKQALAALQDFERTGQIKVF